MVEALNHTLKAYVTLPESRHAAPLFVFAPGSLGRNPASYQWMTDALRDRSVAVAHVEMKDGIRVVQLAQALVTTSRESSSSVLRGRLSGAFFLGAHSGSARATMHEAATWARAHSVDGAGSDGAFLIGLLLFAPEVELVPAPVMELIDVPVLNIVGSQDCIHPASLQQAQLARMTNAAQTALVVVDGATHAAWARDATWFERLVKLPGSHPDWCDGTLPRAAQTNAAFRVIAPFVDFLQTVESAVAVGEGRDKARASAWVDFEGVLARGRSDGRWWYATRPGPLEDEMLRESSVRVRACCCAKEEALLYPDVCWPDEDFIKQWTGPILDRNPRDTMKIMCWAEYYNNWHHPQGITCAPGEGAYIGPQNYSVW